LGFALIRSDAGVRIALGEASRSNRSIDESPRIDRTRITRKPNKSRWSEGREGREGRRAARDE
jgi:hypothetical protein